MDACVSKDVVAGKDHYSVKASRTAIDNMKESAKAYIEEKGYVVNEVVSPFACGFKNADAEYSVKLDMNEGSGEVVSQVPPFYVEEEIKSKSNYKDALARTLNMVTKATCSKEDNLIDLYSSYQPNRYIAEIDKEVGADLLLFVVGNGRGVPWAKSAVQDIGTSVISSIAISALSGGMYEGSVSTRQVSYLDTYASLIDPESGEMIWAKSSRIKEFNPESEAAYKVFGVHKWAGRYFKQLPDKKKKG